jgi:enoyl-[acyl-carrier protein] reductase I
MLLEGKKILVTGVLTPQSIAFEVARIAQQEGAEIVLSGFGKALALTQRSARRLPRAPEVLEMDVNDDDQIAAVAAHVRNSWGSLDGFLHAIAFAPEDALGGAFLDTPRASAEIAFRTSAYSLKALTVGMLPLLDEGGSVVSLDFDASVAWPIYDWMGVSKAALEAVTRYLARDLGRKSIRVNCVSAGPLRTMAARSIPGFDQITSAWEGRAPLGWDPNDPKPVAQAVVFLLSDLSSGITGEIVHVDGGYHAMGAGLGERPD